MDFLGLGKYLAILQDLDSWRSRIIESLLPSRLYVYQVISQITPFQLPFVNYVLLRGYSRLLVEPKTKGNQKQSEHLQKREATTPLQQQQQQPTLVLYKSSSSSFDHL